MTPAREAHDDRSRLIQAAREKLALVDRVGPAGRRPGPRRDGGDLIFALHREATLRRRGGERVIDGTLGVLLDEDGELVVLPSVRRAMQELPPAEWFPYAPVAGEPAFLEAVARQVLGGHPAMHDAAVAVATPGGTGAIGQAIGTFLARGQTALTTSHHWPCYAEIAREHHRRLDRFQMFADPACAALDVEALDRGLARIISAQGRALLILNDPCQNPTGYSMTAADWNDVTEVVAARSRLAPVAVLLDCAYSDYGASGLDLPLRALERLAGRALVAIAWSASKSLTAYGLRVGALLAVPVSGDQRGELAARLANRARGSWGNCNRGGMVAVSRILDDAELSQAVWSERRVAIGLLRRRARLFEQAAARHGLSHPRVGGGFFGTVLSRSPMRAAAAMREQGLFVVPGRRALRIALSALPAAAIGPAMEIVSACLGPHRTPVAQS
jgi:aromatic-amino-acid transaminase